MEITCSKTIFADIEGNSTFYLPEIQHLSDKKITAVAVSDMWQGDGSGKADFNKMYLNLTSDGYNYFFSDYPLTHLVTHNILGLFEEFNERLEISKCFIRSTSDKKTTVAITFFYKDSAYSHPQQSARYGYESVDMKLVYPDDATSLRLRLPDVRNLAGKRIKQVLMSNSYFSILEDSKPYGGPLSGVYLTLRKGSQIIHDRLPGVYLFAYNYSEFLTFDNIEFDCENSYIEAFGAVGDLKKAGSIVLTFKYER